MFLVFCLGLCLHVTPSLGYANYQEHIPNGNNIPHPCKNNYRWSGVGHKNPKGGGDRNVFGLDFQAANHKWTEELCRKDSDKDGRTNGEELGDPGCEWSPGQLPSRTADITHPGGTRVPASHSYLQDSQDAQDTQETPGFPRDPWTHKMLHNLQENQEFSKDSSIQNRPQNLQDIPEFTRYPRIHKRSLDSQEFTRFTSGNISLVQIVFQGVCDPYNSTQCVKENSFLICTLDAFEGCKSIRNPNVTTIDLKFNKTQVPSSETNYMCMAFNISRNIDYHIIASEPLIDNSIVLHHMLLFACINDNGPELSTPTICDMGSYDCPTIIGGWTVGLSGQCFGPKTGFRIGMTGYKKVRLQIHYNNPLKVSHYMDESGIRLYVQPDQSAGVQDMVTMKTGQSLLHIPPGKRWFEQVGICKPGCYGMLMSKPIYIIGAINHMHYLGRSMTVELFRDGVKVTNITYDSFYSYDSPIIHNYNPPIEVRPNDEIKTTCVYNSLSKEEDVFFGPATSDEMCYGFMYAYPKDAFRSIRDCDAIGGVSDCDRLTGRSVDGCDWKAYISKANTSIVDKNLAQKCLNDKCREECREYLKTIKDHPCLKGGAATFVKESLKRRSNDLQLYKWLNSCNFGQADDQSDGANTMIVSIAISVLSTACHLMFK